MARRWIALSALGLCFAFATAAASTITYDPMGGGYHHAEPAPRSGSAPVSFPHFPSDFTDEFSDPLGHSHAPMGYSRSGWSVFPAGPSSRSGSGGGGKGSSGQGGNSGPSSGQSSGQIPGSAGGLNDPIGASLLFSFDEPSPSIDDPGPTDNKGLAFQSFLEDEDFEEDDEEGDPAAPPFPLMSEGGPPTGIEAVPEPATLSLLLLGLACLIGWKRWDSGWPDLTGSRIALA